MRVRTCILALVALLGVSAAASHEVDDESGAPIFVELSSEHVSEDHGEAVDAAEIADELAGVPVIMLQARAPPDDFHKAAADNVPLVNHASLPSPSPIITRTSVDNGLSAMAGINLTATLFEFTELERVALDKLTLVEARPDRTKETLQAINASRVQLQQLGEVVTVVRYLLQQEDGILDKRVQLSHYNNRIDKLHKTLALLRKDNEHRATEYLQLMDAAVLGADKATRAYAAAKMALDREVADWVKSQKRSQKSYVNKTTARLGDEKNAVAHERENLQALYRVAGAAKRLLDAPTAPVVNPSIGAGTNPAILDLKGAARAEADEKERAGWSKARAWDWHTVSEGDSEVESLREAIAAARLRIAGLWGELGQEKARQQRALSLLAKEQGEGQASVDGSERDVDSMLVHHMREQVQSLMQVVRSMIHTHHVQEMNRGGESGVWDMGAQGLQRELDNLDGQRKRLEKARKQLEDELARRAARTNKGAITQPGSGAGKKGAMSLPFGASILLTAVHAAGGIGSQTSKMALPALPGHEGDAPRVVDSVQLLHSTAVQRLLSAMGLPIGPGALASGVASGVANVNLGTGTGSGGMVGSTGIGGCEYCTAQRSIARLTDEILSLRRELGRCIAQPQVYRPDCRSRLSFQVDKLVGEVKRRQGVLAAEEVEMVRVLNYVKDAISACDGKAPQPHDPQPPTPLVLKSATSTPSATPLPSVSGTLTATPTPSPTPSHTSAASHVPGSATSTNTATHTASASATPSSSPLPPVEVGVIRHVRTGLVWTVDNQHMGEPIRLRSSEASSRKQQFIRHKDGSLQNVNTGMFIHPWGGWPNQGARLITWTQGHMPRLQFQWTADNHVRAPLTGMFVHIEWDSPTIGREMIWWSGPGGGDMHMFAFDRDPEASRIASLAEEGYIVHAQSGLYWGVNSGEMADHVRFQRADYSSRQKWLRHADGSIQSVHSGLFIHPWSGWPNVGMSLITWSTAHTKAKEYTFGPDGSIHSQLTPHCVHPFGGREVVGNHMLFWYECGLQRIRFNWMPTKPAALPGSAHRFAYHEHDAGMGLSVSSEAGADVSSGSGASVDVEALAAAEARAEAEAEGSNWSAEAYSSWKDEAKQVYKDAGYENEWSDDIQASLEAAAVPVPAGAGGAPAPIAAEAHAAPHHHAEVVSGMRTSRRAPLRAAHRSAPFAAHADAAASSSAVAGSGLQGLSALEAAASDESANADGVYHAPAPLMALPPLAMVELQARAGSRHGGKTGGSQQQLAANEGASASGGFFDWARAGLMGFAQAGVSDAAASPNPAAPAPPVGPASNPASAALTAAGSGFGKCSAGERAALIALRRALGAELDSRGRMLSQSLLRKQYACLWQHRNNSIAEVAAQALTTPGASAADAAFETSLAFLELGAPDAADSYGHDNTNDASMTPTVRAFLTAALVRLHASNPYEAFELGHDAESPILLMELASTTSTARSGSARAGAHEWASDEEGDEDEGADAPLGFASSGRRAGVRGHRWHHNSNDDHHIDELDSVAAVAGLTSADQGASHAAGGAAAPNDGMHFAQLDANAAGGAEADADAVAAAIAQVVADAEIESEAYTFADMTAEEFQRMAAEGGVTMEQAIAVLQEGRALIEQRGGVRGLTEADWGWFRRSFNFWRPPPIRWSPPRWQPPRWNLPRWNPPAWNPIRSIVSWLARPTWPRINLPRIQLPRIEFPRPRPLGWLWNILFPRPTPTRTARPRIANVPHISESPSPSVSPKASASLNFNKSPVPGSSKAAAPGVSPGATAPASTSLPNANGDIDDAKMPKRLPLQTMRKHQQMLNVCTALRDPAFAAGDALRQCLCTELEEIQSLQRIALKQAEERAAAYAAATTAISAVEAQVAAAKKAQQEAALQAAKDALFQQLKTRPEFANLVNGALHPGGPAPAAGQ